MSKLSLLFKTESEQGASTPTSSNSDTNRDKVSSCSSSSNLNLNKHDFVSEWVESQQELDQSFDSNHDIDRLTFPGATYNTKSDFENALDLWISPNADPVLVNTLSTWMDRDYEHNKQQLAYLPKLPSNVVLRDTSIYHINLVRRSYFIEDSE